MPDLHEIYKELFPVDEETPDFESGELGYDPRMHNRCVRIGRGIPPTRCTLPPLHPGDCVFGPMPPLHKK